MNDRTPNPTLTGLPGLLRRNEPFLLFVVDLVLVACAFVGAMVLRYDATALGRLNGLILACVPAMTTITALIFVSFGLYSRKWRDASFADALAIVAAVAVSMTLFFAVSRIDGRLSFLPIGVIVLTGILATVSVGAARLALRVSGLRHRFFRLLNRLGGSEVGAHRDPLPIVVVGAGDETCLYLRALSRDPHQEYRPVAVLDDGEPVGSFLRGVQVLGGLDAFGAVVNELDENGMKPRHVVFAQPLAQLGLEASQALIAEAEGQGIPVSCVASPTQLHDPSAEGATELRPIELTDLLDRPQAALDRSAVAGLLAGRVVAVTGAGGSIGSELVRQVARYSPRKLILIDNCEFNLYAIDRDLTELRGARELPAPPQVVPCLCDIRHSDRVEGIFAEHRPDLVFNAAALKHVPMVELNPCEGVLTNIVGTACVAEAARRHGALAMVQISTDKAVDSTSVMGATKRMGELYCQALDLEGAGNGSGAGTRFMTTRFGNVLGSSGSLIPLFKRQLEQGGPLTVTDPRMTRFFMTIREAVELTLQASAFGLADDLGHGEIFVLDMGEPLRIIDIAHRMIRLAGLEPERDIEVKIVGCRPGEKLFEELFDSHEERVASPIAGVLGAIPQSVPLERLSRTVAQLERHAGAGDTRAVFALLEEIMPRYRPSAIHASSASPCVDRVPGAERSPERETVPELELAAMSVPAQ